MQHVIFDFDGTLVDSRQLGLDLYNEIAARRGFQPMTDERIEALRQMPMMERFSSVGVPIHRLPSLALEFTRLYGSILDRLAFFDGIPDLLASLEARGVTLHVLSSNSEDNIRRFLSSQGITVMATITSARNVFGKHRALAKLLKRQGLRPQDVLYVGDEERDVVACKQVQVPIAAVTWGFDSPETLKAAGADHLVEQPRDLGDLVSRLTAG
jgi:phosphoglycolate phosphatase